VAVQKKKKPIFKTASDGRLIIKEDSSESEGDNAKDVDSGKFITVDKMTTTHYSGTSTSSIYGEINTFTFHYYESSL